jgi:tetratricopeptide (TPR) repeat protein
MNLVQRWYHGQIATWALALKQRDIAYRSYEKILAADPQDAQTLAQVAFLRAEDGNTSAAIQGLERAVAANARDADSWFNLGFLQQESGNHAAALRSFDQATLLNERHDRACFGKALSFIALARHDDAIAPLKKNIALQPMSPHGHMELARCYFKLGDRDRCEKCMRKLKEFDPKNAAQLEDETGIRIGIDRWWHVDKSRLRR